MRALEGYEFPPRERPWVLLLSNYFVGLTPCMGNPNLVPALRPPVASPDQFLPDWASVGWLGGPVDPAKPYYVGCVRPETSHGCQAAVFTASLEGAWFADLASAEAAARDLPDCAQP
jgi:hypothetical protein